MVVPAHPLGVMRHHHDSPHLRATATTSFTGTLLAALLVGGGAILAVLALSVGGLVLAFGTGALTAALLGELHRRLAGSALAPVTGAGIRG